MSLTKHGIVEQLQSELGFQKNQSLEIVESILEIIKATLESGEDVLVSGFGKLVFGIKRNGKVGIQPLARM